MGKVCRGYKNQKCIVTDQEQNYEEFYKSPRMKDGYTNLCRTCDKHRKKVWYQENREEALEKTKAYGKKNRHITRKASKNYYYKDPQKQIKRKLDWYRQNPDKAAASASRYRARKKNATPSWLSGKHLEEMRQIFLHARDCSIICGEKYQVDHVLPLAGENVCGLHVPWNLQILPSDLNIRKGNSYDAEEDF